MKVTIKIKISFHSILPKENAKFAWNKNDEQLDHDYWVIYRFKGIFGGLLLRMPRSVEEETEKTEKCPQWKVKNVANFLFALFSCCEFLLRKKDMLWFPSTWSHISLQNKKITNTHTEPKLSFFVI